MIMECKTDTHTHTYTLFYMQLSDITWFWANTRPKFTTAVVTRAIFVLLLRNLITKNVIIIKQFVVNFETLFPHNALCSLWSKKSHTVVVVVVLSDFVLSFWNMISIRNRITKSRDPVFCWSTIIMFCLLLMGCNTLFVFNFTNLLIYTL
jgi:hypothetical protein